MYLLCTAYCAPPTVHRLLRTAYCVPLTVYSLLCTAVAARAEYVPLPLEAGGAEARAHLRHRQRRHPGRQPRADRRGQTCRGQRTGARTVHPDSPLTMRGSRQRDCHLMAPLPVPQCTNPAELSREEGWCSCGAVLSSAECVFVVVWMGCNSFHVCDARTVPRQCIDGAWRQHLAVGETVTLLHPLSLWQAFQ